MSARKDRVQKKLDLRIAAYQASAAKPNATKGIRKPGSQNRHKS